MEDTELLLKSGSDEIISTDSDKGIDTNRHSKDSAMHALQVGTKFVFGKDPRTSWILVVSIPSLEAPVN
jgi:hypothetical protein